MTQQIENEYVTEILDRDELKQYVRFEEGLRAKARKRRKRLEKIGLRSPKRYRKT